VVHYPQWVDNVVIVSKKDDRIRVCVDYRDLNKASMEDDFPLPYIDVLVDNAMKSVIYSFMDGFLGYNHCHNPLQRFPKFTFFSSKKNKDWRHGENRLRRI
jgi:hypothetical protein